MAYGSALGVSVPVVSTTPGPTYATTINTFLQALQAVVEQKVRPSDMDINADLSYLSGATYYRAKDLKAASFHNEAAALNAVSYPTSVYFTGADGNAFVNDAAGNQIQLTASGAVNVSTTGGITGSGYGTAGVEVNWDSGNAAYHFRTSAAANAYGDVICDDVRLNDGSGNYLSLVAPAMLADYTFTFPDAVPATSNTVLAMAITGAVTATATPTVTTLATTGAATVGSTLGVTGLITATAGMTCANNQNVTISGTGRFKHGSRVLNIHPTNGRIINGSPTVGLNYAWVAGAASDQVAVALPMNVGERITNVAFTGNDAGGSFWRGQLWKGNATDGTISQVGGNADSAATGIVTATLSALTDTVETGEFFFVLWEAGASGDTFQAIAVTYDHP